MGSRVIVIQRVRVGHHVPWVKVNVGHGRRLQGSQKVALSWKVVNLHKSAKQVPDSKCANSLP
jgi:hypothetical protein